MGQRKAVTSQLAAEDRRGSRIEKAWILDELCRLTDWHRDHDLRALRLTGTVTVAKLRTARPPTHSDELITALTLAWRVPR